MQPSVYRDKIGIFINSATMKKNILNSFVNDEWERHKERYRAYFLPLLLILFTLIFRDKAISIVSSILVNPLLSTIQRSTILIDIFCLSLMGFVIAALIRKGIRKIRISVPLVAYTLAFAIIYLNFRINESSPFEFVAFRIPFLSYMRLADIMLSPMVGLITYYTFFFIYSSK